MQYHIRTFPSTFDNLRADATNNFDASVLKRFDLAGGAYFQIRFEVFNVLNHFTPLDVQNDLDSQRFGDYFNGPTRAFRGKFVVGF